ncbi:MAG: gluconokinase [Chloroflexi bacterium]|nr:gluconokinase [Chloroflexota bacterium]
MPVLVIDIGSSSVRALLLDRHLIPIPGAVARREYSFSTSPVGAATLDPAALQDTVEACIDEVLQHPGADHILGVGMATFAGNLLGVDANGVPRTPVFTYADTRSAPDVEILAHQVDPEVTWQRTGCRLHTAYHPARLHWLRRSRPDLFDQVALWLDLASFLYQQWFGATPASYSLASWTGLLNRSTLQWDPDWLQLLGLSAADLPRLADYDALQAGLREPYATRWPVLRDKPFSLAIGDGAATHAGATCFQPDCLSLSVGTTAALRVAISETTHRIPSGLWNYRIDQRLHLLGGATAEGGNVFAWAKQTLNLPPDATTIEGELSTPEPFQHNLTALPLLGGERSPGWATRVSGALHGLTLETTAVDILQALLESIALRLSTVLQQLSPLSGPTPRVVASGGALAASPAWAQMIASAFNCPLHVTGDPEITARGIGMLLLGALGIADVRAWAMPPARVVSPQSAYVERFRDAREHQQRLYEFVVGEND